MGLTGSHTEPEKISSMDVMSTNKVGSTRGSKMEFTFNEETTPGYDLHFKDNSILTPNKILFNNANKNLLVLTPQKRDTLVRIDTETGKTLDEYHLKFHEDLETPFYAVTPSKKFSQLKSNDTVSLTGLSGNSVFNFDWDTRTPTKNIVLDESSIQTINSTKYTSVATTKTGDIVVGDLKGHVRLFQTPQNGLKKAKTLFNQFSDDVVNVDTSSDGEWVIWTTKEYVAVVNTKFSNNGVPYTGFNKSMGKDRPSALVLKISDEDMKYHGIDEVNFTGARFDNGPYMDLNDGNIIEEEIIASTGKFLVRWRMRHVSAQYKADVNERKYIKPLIYEQKGNIVDKSFQYGEKRVVAALEDKLNTLSFD